MNDGTELPDDLNERLRRSDEALRLITPEMIRQNYAEMQQKVAEAILELNKPRPKNNNPS